jgi:hypothetical protein
VAYDISARAFHQVDDDDDEQQRRRGVDGVAQSQCDAARGWHDETDTNRRAALWRRHDQLTATREEKRNMTTMKTVVYSFTAPASGIERLLDVKPGSLAGIGLDVDPTDDCRALPKPNFV